MIKNLIFPAYVMSKTDGGEHFITGHQLIKLYRLNPAECMVINNDRDLRGLRKEDYECFYPNYYGDYK